MQPKELFSVGTLEQWIEKQKSELPKAFHAAIVRTSYVVNGADRDGPRLAVDENGKVLAQEAELPSGQVVVLRIGSQREPMLKPQKISAVQS